MLLLQRKFFKPSRRLRLLALLEMVKENGSSSQSKLGLKTSLSGAMVNKYLREMQGDGLTDVEPVNGKSVTYSLTPKGETERRELFDQYCAEIVQVYTALKLQVSRKLSDLENSGVRRLVLFGASETCEVVLSVLKERSLSVLTILDNDPDKHGRVFHGYVVSPPQVLDSLDCQAVVITSFGRRGEIHAQLAPLAGKKGFEIVEL